MEKTFLYFVLNFAHTMEIMKKRETEAHKINYALNIKSINSIIKIMRLT